MRGSPVYLVTIIQDFQSALHGMLKAAFPEVTVQKSGADLKAAFANLESNLFDLGQSLGGVSEFLTP
jgi:hypothetical protein